MKYLILLLFCLPLKKDVREYDNICNALWQEFDDNYVEFVAYVTLDNKLIATSTGSTFNTGKSLTLTKFNGNVYVKADVDGSYKGAIKNRFGLFIPIKAMIHSHNPKCKLPISGVEEISEKDKKIAIKYVEIKHFIYGCDWFAQFDENGIIASEHLRVKECNSWLQ